HDVVALGRVADLHLLETPLGLLLVAHELLHRVPHRVRRRVGGEERDEDELVAELAELLERERVRILVPAEGRRVVERERQPRMRLAFNYSSTFRWHQDPNPLTFKERTEEHTSEPQSRI